MTRIVLRPLASPLPLAFFAFGAGSLMLSGLQLGIIPASEARSVAIVQAPRSSFRPWRCVPCWPFSPARRSARPLWP